FAQLLTMLLVVKGLSLPESKRLVVALTMIELLTSYLHLRSAQATELRPYVKDEFKKVFLGYLQFYAEQNG
ncbi:MAG TPA: hypothetical protein V6C72_19675, partial [Chroococcales cyanobacterium]